MAKKENRRETIINCAISLMETHGLAALNARSIATHLEIASSNVFYYFPHVFVAAVILTQKFCKY